MSETPTEEQRDASHPLRLGIWLGLIGLLIALNYAGRYLIEAPEGLQPVVPGSRPPFRPDVPCQENAVPDINGPASAVGPSDLTAIP